MTKRPSLRTCNGNGLRALVESLRYSGDRDALRQALIFCAGALQNVRLKRDLGSQEASTWFEGRRAADPMFKNPYWPDK